MSLTVNHVLAITLFQFIYFAIEQGNGSYFL